MRIVGITTSCGEYKGIAYNKLVFHTLSPLTRSDSFGEECVRNSINITDCGQVLSAVSGEIQKLIGREVDIFYNRYGKPTSIILKGDK